MISARSLHLLLSGSKIILSSFLFVFLLASCGGSKKTISEQSDSKLPKRAERNLGVKGNSARVDTIHWTEIDKSKEYEKTIEDLELDKRSKYNVGLLFPFGIENNDMMEASDPKSKLGRMTSYYAGVKMALETLRAEDIALNVTVMDAESGNFDMKLQQCREMDVIVGPREKGQLSTAAQYAKNNEIPLISPWLSSSRIAKKNPYYIQLKPDLKSHLNKIIEDVIENYSSDQIILLGRENHRKDKNMMNYIQKIVAADKSNSIKSFNEFYINTDSLLTGIEAYDKIFLEEKETVFILPNWSFVDDEQYVYNAVRKLNGEKGLNKVILYGMPILLESDRVNYEHYSNLNMRICRTSYLDRNSPEVANFRKYYFAEYNDFPSEEVFKGFDMMMFLGRSLKNYGKKFQYFLDTYESSLFQTEFSIEKVVDDIELQHIGNIKYFQNNHLYLLKFENDHFVLH